LKELQTRPVVPWIGRDRCWLKSPQVSGILIPRVASCATACSRFQAGGIDRGHIPDGHGPSEKRKKQSVPQLELFGNRLVARQIRMMEIIQQAAALADHDQEATAGAVVLDILLQMFGQVIDALGQKSDLHVSGPCVALVKSEPCYRLSFFHISISINNV
jgi:hypothetical protein